MANRHSSYTLDIFYDNKAMGVHMSLWMRIKLLRLFIQLVINPNRTDLIFRGVDIVSKDPNQQALKTIEQHVLKNQTFRQMHQEHYIPVPPRLDALKNLPADSFGAAVYHHMRTNDLGFEIFPRSDSSRPVKYLSDRIYQDHDLWHALLGYGVEVEDELAVQAFGVAQFQSPIATMLIAGGLLHLLRKDPMRAVAAFNKVVEGYNLGKNAQFLLSVKLHDLFAKPLLEVREICGLPPYRGTQFS